MQRTAIITFLLLGALLPALAQDRGEDLETLEAFSIREQAILGADTLLPSEQEVSGAFFGNMSLLETPRSVLVLNPETLEQFDIEDFDDLAKFGAGTETINFFGIPGAPVIRGWKGGTYYNGMLRAFNRNQSPTSFGAMESIEVIKGPAPAHLVPAHVGGYVNMIPKQPFFDEARGSMQAEIESTGELRLQGDVGQPLLLAPNLPMAYRLSVTSQQGEGYYDDVVNNFYSIYGAATLRFGERTRLFLAAEYYDYDSNENAGWNRPTQNLVDNGEYVIGEPLSLVRAGNGGVADRRLVGSIGFRLPEVFNALVLPNALVESAVADGRMTAGQRALLLDMNDAANQAAVYDGLPDDIARTTAGYVYTPDYLEAGGEVFTAPIEGSTVLADPSDFADSQDTIAFAGLQHELSEETRLLNDFLFEYLETDKRSSYGYAFYGEQMVLDNRLALEFSLPERDWLSARFMAGVQGRYTDATQLQDFWVEPFARRDITREEISANSVILAGEQIDPLHGEDYWGGGPGPGFYPRPGPAGHAVTSELWQGAGFVLTDLRLTDYFQLVASARYENFDWDVAVPGGTTNVTGDPYSGSEDGFSFALNPTLKLSDRASLYFVYQDASTYVPTDGGAFLGESNLGEGQLREGGLKLSLLDNKLFATLAYYEWEQVGFNDRSGVREPYESEGFELEVTWQPTPDLTLIGAFTDRQTYRKFEGEIDFRTLPWGTADPTGANDPERGLAVASGSLYAAGGGDVPEANPLGRVPGSPETTVKLHAIAENVGIDGLGLAGGLEWRDAYWHNFDRTIRLPEATLLRANIFYDAENWRLLFGVENLTNEDYFAGAEPFFAANTLLTKAPERTYRVSATLRF